MNAVARLVTPSHTDIPGLRDAYAAETAAVNRICDIKRRLPLAEAEVVLRQRDREAMSGRAARGEAVTGADLRKADEAVLDAQALATLLREALPKARDEALAAHKLTTQLTRPIWSERRQAAADAHRIAEEALEEARETFNRTLAATQHLPDHVVREVSAVLAAHGRDIHAEVAIDEIDRKRELNRARKMAGQPLMEE